MPATCELIELCSEGDRKIVEWDPFDLKQVVKAQEEFDKQRKAGHLLFALDKKGVKQDEVKYFIEIKHDARFLYEFDPKAEKIVAMKPIVGG